MTYDAVILDSDGVLVEPPTAETVRTAASDFFDGIDLDIGPESGGLVRDFLDGNHEGFVERCRASGSDVAEVCHRVGTTAYEVQRRELERGLRSVYDDVRALATIDESLGLVSDNQPQFVAYLLRQFDLDEYFETVRCRSVTPSGIRRTKPDSRNLRAALSDLGAYRAVYVGDRPSDVEAAHSLDIDSVRVAREDEANDPDDWPVTPDYRIDGLDELPAVVE